MLEGYDAGGWARGACAECGARRGRRAGPLACLAACCLLLAYTMAGAGLFLALEGHSAAPAPAPPAASQPELRAHAVQRLWAITEDLNILYKENWTALAARELLRFQRALLSARDAGLPPPDDQRWTFSSSFLYALTLVTTIGSGSACPRSAAGKLASMLYAGIGIPVVLLYLSTVGAALADACRAMYVRARPAACRVPRTPRPAPHQRVADGMLEPATPFQAALNLRALRAGSAAGARCGRAHVPPALALLPAALYVVLGALLFHATEGWSLQDGAYFSFCSLATIGFGPLRPGRRAAAVSPRAHDAALGACCLYILVGVAVVAMCFDLVQEGAAAALARLHGRACAPPDLPATPS